MDLRLCSHQPPVRSVPGLATDLPCGSPCSRCKQAQVRQKGSLKSGQKMLALLLAPLALLLNVYAVHAAAEEGLPSVHASSHAIPAL